MRIHNALEKELQYEMKDLPIIHQRKILDIIRLIKKGGGSSKKHDILELNHPRLQVEGFNLSRLEIDCHRLWVRPLALRYIAVSSHQ